MAKYQVLKRVPVQMKDGQNNLIDGEMVEFLQIPDSGISQVQVYFVPSDKTDADILGVATAHHENELQTKNVSFPGPQAPLNGVESNIEELVTVDYTLNPKGEVVLKKPLVK